MDVYGLCLIGFFMLEKVIEWVVSQLEEWGLENVYIEEWGFFGCSWELQYFEMYVYILIYWFVIGVFKVWLFFVKVDEVEVIYLEVNIKEEFDVYKGKLKGKIVLVDMLCFIEEWFDVLACWYESDDLFDMVNVDMLILCLCWNYNMIGGFFFNKYLWEILVEEDLIVVFDCSYKGDLGMVFVLGVCIGEWGSYWEEGVKVVFQIILAVEYYNCIF